MKTWLTEHKKSELFAMAAEEAMRDGDSEATKDLYIAAAMAEDRALTLCPPDKVRTLEITRRIAEALWAKAKAI